MSICTEISIPIVPSPGPAIRNEKIRLLVPKFRSLCKHNIGSILEKLIGIIHVFTIIGKIIGKVTRAY